MLVLSESGGNKTPSLVLCFAYLIIHSACWGLQTNQPPLLPPHAPPPLSTHTDTVTHSFKKKKHLQVCLIYILQVVLLSLVALCGRSSVNWDIWGVLIRNLMLQKNTVGIIHDTLQSFLATFPSLYLASAYYLASKGNHQELLNTLWWTKWAYHIECKVLPLCTISVWWICQ